IQNWDNLFMGCGYCNRKKSNSFDNILNPKNCNVEEEIEQRINFADKRALFVSKEKDAQHNDTIELLNRIFNGTGRTRKFKEERFFEQVLGVVNSFLELVRNYLNNPIPDAEKAVKDELMIDKELLGFKYWIIRDVPALYEVFAQDIQWNK
ncbi:MAG: hypothetical protein IKZ83_00050, partial [Prevotella sp.]|nr:hypothetical protein [Prevotella sp.]